MANDSKILGTVARDLPALRADGAEVSVRTTGRGELITMPAGKPRCALANEGSYFLATNPTPGTGIAGIAATGAFSDAESLLVVRNAAAVSTGKRVHLDYLRLQVTAAGTNGTDVRYVSKLDKGGVRYTSGGSAITVVNPNMDSAAATSATVHFGALVTAAATSDARLVGNGLVRNVIGVVGDEYLFDFGGSAHVATAHAVAGTAIAKLVIPHAPVVLGPEHSFVFSIHAASQTGAISFEFELGYWER
jgi:hypothetical protein